MKLSVSRVTPAVEGRLCSTLENSTECMLFRSGFQMTVKSTYAIMIGLKISRQFFNQSEAKPKPIVPCTLDFFRAPLSKLQVIAGNCEFSALFAPIVIDRRE